MGRSSVRERHLISVESATIAFDESGYAPTTAPASLLGFVDHAPEIVTLDNLRNAVMTGLKFVVDVPPDRTRLLRVAGAGDRDELHRTPDRSVGEPVLDAVREGEGQVALLPALSRRCPHPRLVAAKPDSASARTIGQIGLALTTAASGLIPQYQSGGLVIGDVDRILNRPTNHAWIDPWVAYLRGRGVRFAMGGAGLAQLNVARGRITGARLTTGSTVESDWYVAAMPIDRLKPLLSPELVSADPTLAGIHQLQDDWMVGIQYFLSRRSELPPGHIAALGTPVGADGPVPGAALEGRLLPQVRRRSRERLPVHRHLGVGEAGGDPVRKACEAVHQAGDRPGGVGADEPGDERRWTKDPELRGHRDMVARSRDHVVAEHRQRDPR